MSSLLVLLLVCSIFAIHISCFRSVQWKSFIFSDSGHRASAGVSLPFCGWGREESAAGSNKGQLVLRNCSVWLRTSVVSPSVILFAEHGEVLDKLNQGLSVSQQHQRATDTTDTSGEETDTSQSRRRVRSKRTFKMKKSYATSELARFFLTGPTDASTKLCEFYCRLCRKDVSVLTHGSPEVLRHFQGIRHFARDQRLRHETPGWRVLGFDGKPLTEDELERQRDKILRAPLVVRDREYPFREDLIPDAPGNTDPQLPVLAKVSSLVDVLHLGGSYELVERLWERFVLSQCQRYLVPQWSFG